MFPFRTFLHSSYVFNFPTKRMYTIEYLCCLLNISNIFGVYCTILKEKSYDFSEPPAYNEIVKMVDLQNIKYIACGFLQNCLWYIKCAFFLKKSCLLTKPHTISLMLCNSINVATSQYARGFEKGKEFSHRKAQWLPKHIGDILANNTNIQLYVCIWLENWSHNCYFVAAVYIPVIV